MFDDDEQESERTFSQTDLSGGIDADFDDQAGLDFARQQYDESY